MPVELTELPFEADAKFVVSFSGGKDSVATWLHLTRDRQLKDVTCVFADTGHESDVTYKYLDYLQEQGCVLVRVQATMRDLRNQWPLCWSPEFLDSPLTMEKLSTWKSRFPSPTRRFCTTFLKLNPLHRYLSQFPQAINVCGVRADESEARRDLPEVSYDMDLQHNVWRPIIDWTAADVFECHRRHSIEPNPLYKLGCGRVGCFPCIMARKPELSAISRYFPSRMKELYAMEVRVAKACGKKIMTFFSRKVAPPYYRSQVDPQSGHRISTALDIERWATETGPRGEEQHDLLGEKAAPSCTSIYGLCE